MPADAPDSPADSPLAVHTRRGWPERIRLGAVQWRVARVDDVWVVRSRWWHHDEQRVYFALVTDTGRRLIIYRTREHWYLAEVQD